MDEKTNILIIDDDESTRTSLKLIFEKTGYETEEAGTGREAAEKARERFFNVALLDIRMPDMEGTELLPRLKEMHPDMAVIMATGYASLETAVRALNEGASAYITKPLNMDEVLTAVGAAVEKQRLVMENRRLFEVVQQELAERKRAEEALRQSLEKTAHSQRILLALSQAAETVQRVRSATEIYRSVGDEIKKLGFEASILLATEDLSELKIEHLTFDPEKIRTLEKLTGLPQESFRIPLNRGGRYFDILSKKEIVFFDSIDDVTAYVLPKALRPLANKITSILGLGSIIHAPLVSGGKSIGLLAVTGTGLSADDIPAIRTFANQVANALENTQLLFTIRDSESRFSAVVRTASDAIVTIDDEGEIVFWNAAATTIFGYSEDEAMGQPISFLMPRIYRGPFTKGIARLISRGETKILGKVVELQGLKKDGTEFPGELALSAWEADEKTYFTALIRDITERKEAQDIITIHLERLEVLRQIDLAISSSLDLSTTLEVLLDQITQRLGLDAADVLLFDLDKQVLQHAAGRGFTTEALQYTKLEFGEGYAGQVVANRETLFVPDLSQEPGSLLQSPLFGSEGFIAYFCAALIVKGEVKGVIELFHRSKLEPDEEWFEFVEMLTTQAAIAIDNATMYRELEQHSAFLEQAVEEATGKLRHSKDRLETILDNSPDAILLLSNDGRIEHANQAVEVLLGYSPDELDGAVVGTLLDPAVDLDVGEELAQLAMSTQSTRRELSAIRKDGASFDAEVILTPIEHGDTSKAFVCTIRNVSAWTELQRMKDAFVSNVSHELRTPITSIKLCQGLMKMNPDASDEYLDRMGREIDRLNTLIEDLLRLSRLDQGKVSLSRELISLDKLGSEYALDRRLLAEDKGLQLSFASDQVVPPVLADEALLGQALSVILTNAINYTPGGGTIQITTRRCEKDGQEWAGICVGDDGPGIAEQDLPHLFERFYRGASGRESGAPGTGLGLSIAHEIVRKHQGRIEAHNRETGTGAVFSVWLPVSEDDIEK